MAAVAGLHVSLSADTADFVRGLNDAANEVHGLFGKMVGAELAADAIKQMASSMFDVGKQSLQLAGDLEQSKIAFTTMLGSAEKAEAFLSELAQFAANTPFEMKGLQDASRKLLAFGFDAKNIVPIMTSVGNAVSGLGGGAEQINRVTMALGQMQAKGKISAEEMMQLAELGIPAWELLAKKIGVSVPEAMKMAEKGAIPAAKGIEALVNGMNERFPAMMEKQSKTLLGAWSNLQDGITMALTNIGTEIAETFNITETVAALGRVTSAVASEIKSSGLDGLMNKVFGPETKAAILGIGTAISVAVIPKLYAMVPAALASASAMATAAASAVVAWSPFLILAGAIAFAATPIIRYWDDIAFELGRVFDFVSGAAGSFVNAVAKGFQHLANNVVGPVVRFVSEKLSALWAMLPQQAKDALAGAGVAFSGFGASIGGALQIAGVEIGKGASFVAGNFKESFSGFGDMANGVQSIINTFTGAATGDLAKLQKDATLHLAGAGKALGSLGKAASSAGSTVSKEAKALAAAVKAAAKEIEASLERGQDALKSFSGRVSVFTDLNKDLKRMQLEAELFGDGFVDAAQAADRVKKAVLDLVDKGVSRANPEFQRLLKLQQQYAASAAPAAKAITAVEVALNENWSAMAKASQKAELLGASFDLTEEQAKILTATVEKLAEIGGGEAAPAIALLREELERIKPVQDATTFSVDTFKTSVTNVQNAIGALREGLSTIATTLGINLNTALMTGITQAGNFALALVQVGTSVGPLMESIKGLMGQVPGLVSQLTTMTATTAASLGPIGLAALAVGGFAAAIAASSSSMQEAVENSKALVYFMGPIGPAVSAVISVVQFLASKLDTLVSAFKSVASVGRRVFFEIVNAAKTGLNGFIKVVNAMVGGVNAILGVFGMSVPYMQEFATESWDQAEASRAAAEALAQQAAAVADLTKALDDSLRSGVASAMGNAVKGFLDGTKDMTEALREGIKSAIINGITEAVMQGALIKGALGGLLDNLSAGLASGADVSGIVSQIGRQIPGLARQLESSLAPLRAAVQSAFPTSTRDATGGASGSTPGVKGVDDGWAKAYTDFAKGQSGAERWSFDQFFNAMGGKLPALATGGVVSSATVAMIGEGSSPEAVVPLNRGVFSMLGEAIGAYVQVPAVMPSYAPAYAGAGAAPSSGDTTVNIHIEYRGGASERDIEALGQKLVSALRRQGINL